MHGPEGDDEEEDGSGLDDVAAQRIQGDGGLENLEEEEEEDLMNDSRNDCDSSGGMELRRNTKRLKTDIARR